MISKLIRLLAKNAFAILGFSTSAFSGLSWRWNLIFVLFGLLASAVVYLVMELERVSKKRLTKVKGRVLGEGIHDGIHLIRIEHNSNIPDGSILTLYSKGNLLRNPICILKVIGADSGDEIQAIQIAPSTDRLDLNEYFADSNRLRNLFVTPVIKYDELNHFNSY
jgi:hypothetical protein